MISAVFFFLIIFKIESIIWFGFVTVIIATGALWDCTLSWPKKKNNNNIEDAVCLITWFLSLFACCELGELVSLVCLFFQFLGAFDHQTLLSCPSDLIWPLTSRNKKKLLHSLFFPLLCSFLSARSCLFFCVFFPNSFRCLWTSARPLCTSCQPRTWK